MCRFLPFVPNETKFFKEIIFITHNHHKFEEAHSVAKEYGLKLEWYNLEYEEIQADNLETIAIESCKSILKNNPEFHDKFFFIEDSGLFINTLLSFPGPYSSYVYKTIGNEGILKLLTNQKDRQSYFKSIIAFYNTKSIELFTGIVEGAILSTAKEGREFGFDPIFQPKSATQSFAEMSLETKNLYSHRQKSLRELFATLSAFAGRT